MKAHGLQYCDLKRKDSSWHLKRNSWLTMSKRQLQSPAGIEPITGSTYLTRADSIGAFFRNQLEAMEITAVDTTFLSPTRPVPPHRVERCGIEFGGADRVGIAACRGEATLREA